MNAKSPFDPRDLLDAVSGLMMPEPPALRRLRRDAQAAGLPPYHVHPYQGWLLDLLVRSCGVRKAVEVGTLAGYSAACIGRALPPGGRLHTIESDLKRARIALRNVRRLGLDSKVTVHRADAADALASLREEGPFDLCFLDGDKSRLPRHVRWAARNLRPGGIVVVDDAYLFLMGGKQAASRVPGKAAAWRTQAAAMRKALSILGDKDVFASCALLPTTRGLALAVKA